MGASLTATQIRPRRAAWSDRLTAAIERLPWPSWVVYGAGALALSSAVTLADWSAGTTPTASVDPLHVAIAVITLAFLWQIEAVNRQALRALAPTRELLADSPDVAARLTRRLTEAPAGWSLAVPAVWLTASAVRIAGDPAVLTNIRFATRGWEAVVDGTLVVLFVLVAGSYLVKIVAVASGILEISRHQLRVSLWELGPLSGFSLLTARIALSLVLAAAALFITQPSLVVDPFGFAGIALATVMGAAAFVVPLRGIHERLVVEKAGLVGEATQTMELAIERLHESIRKNDLASIDAHNKAVAAVEIELRTLASIPTWPWMPDTLRWVVGALMFPIVLFVLQYVITRVLPG